MRVAPFAAVALIVLHGSAPSVRACYGDGKIIYNLLDGHTVAVDAKSGQELWKTQIADMNQGETTPMAPFVAGNRVIVGPSGGEFGIYGWVKGLDLASGKVVWTAR